MLYDRPYMRPEGHSTSPWTAMHWLLYGTLAAYVLQLIVQQWFQSPAAQDILGLSSDSIRYGFIWTLFTYAFLHGGFLHIGINMLLLYLFGRELAVVLGNKLFCWLYFVAALLGGTFWLAFNLNQPSVLMGASGAVTGLVIFFICMHPDRPIGFFFLPIQFRPRTIAWIIIGISVLGFLFVELPNRGQFGDGRPAVAHSAHLGGALAGYLFFKLIYSSLPDLRNVKPKVEVPRWFRKKSKTAAPAAGKYQVNLTNRRDLQKEVDRILDKINSEGFGSLSEEEKRTLDQAKDILSR